MTIGEALEKVHRSYDDHIATARRQLHSDLILADCDPDEIDRLLAQNDMAAADGREVMLREFRFQLEAFAAETRNGKR